MYFKNIIWKDIINKISRIIFMVWVCLLITSPFLLIPQNRDIGIGVQQVQAYDFSGELRQRAKEYGLAGTNSNETATTSVLPVIIGKVIKSALAFLGVVFLIIIIIAGFRWMWSGGDEETVKKARSSIKNAMIGAIITLGAYAITYYVLSALGL